MKKPLDIPFVIKSQKQTSIVFMLLSTWWFVLWIVYFEDVHLIVSMTFLILSFMEVHSGINLKANYQLHKSLEKKLEEDKQ